MLTPLVLIPLLGALVLLLLPAQVEPVCFRRAAIAILMLLLGWTLLVCLRFDPSSAALQMQESYPWLPSIGLEYRLGIDGLSLPLVLINAALSLVAVICTRDISQRPRIYFALLLLISSAVNGAFLAGNLLLFFLFYELELIPLWLLISVWGGRSHADQLGQEIRSKPLQHCQQKVAGGFLAHDRFTETLKCVAIEVGIKPTSTMPQHCAHAVFSIFEINAIMG